MLSNHHLLSQSQIKTIKNELIEIDSKKFKFKLMALTEFDTLEDIYPNTIYCAIDEYKVHCLTITSGQAAKTIINLEKSGEKFLLSNYPKKISNELQVTILDHLIHKEIIYCPKLAWAGLIRTSVGEIIRFPHNNASYAILDKKIGEGGYGVVKLLQDIESGKVHVIKCMKYVNKSLPDEIKHEAHNLKLMDRSLGALFLPQSKKIYIGIKLEEGVELKKLLDIRNIPNDAMQDNQNLALKNPALILLILLGILRELKNVHQKGLIFRDLKSENIMLWLSPEIIALMNKSIALEDIKVALIDFGSALPILIAKSTHQHGTTKAFLPPEILGPLTVDRDKHVNRMYPVKIIPNVEKHEYIDAVLEPSTMSKEYISAGDFQKLNNSLKFSTKSDIYAFGLVALELFNIGNDIEVSETNYFLDFFQDGYGHYSSGFNVYCIKSEEEIAQDPGYLPTNAKCRREIVTLLISILASNPEQRPSISEIEKVIQAILKTYYPTEVAIPIRPIQRQPSKESFSQVISPNRDVVNFIPKSPPTSPNQIVRSLLMKSKVDSLSSSTPSETPKRKKSLVKQPLSHSAGGGNSPHPLSRTLPAEPPQIEDKLKRRTNSNPIRPSLRTNSTAQVSSVPHCEKSRTKRAASSTQVNMPSIPLSMSADKMRSRRHSHNIILLKKSNKEKLKKI